MAQKAYYGTKEAECRDLQMISGIPSGKNSGEQQLHMATCAGQRA